MEIKISIFLFFWYNIFRRKVGSMGRKRPYGNGVKNRHNPSYNRNHNSMRNNNRNGGKKESLFKDRNLLENTTRIRIDKDRLNDFESLDTSFLEGRRQNNLTKEAKLEKKNSKKKRVNVSTIRRFRNTFYFLGFVSLFALVFVFLFNNRFFVDKGNNNKKGVVEKKDSNVKKDNIIDTNCLFIGGYHTDDFSLDELGGSFPYVKNSKRELFTDDILDSMKKNIYDYNPSVVFFELGIADYLDGKSDSDILRNIRDIITQTKENRPYAEIYVESFFPINKDVDGYPDDMFLEKDNKDLIKFNQELKIICDDVHVHYFDVFSELSVNDKLNEKYTDDGVHLNQDGYKRLFKVVRKIVDSNN